MLALRWKQEDESQMSFARFSRSSRFKFSRTHTSVADTHFFESSHKASLTFAGTAVSLGDGFIAAAIRHEIGRRYVEAFKQARTIPPSRFPSPVLSSCQPIDFSCARAPFTFRLSTPA